MLCWLCVSPAFLCTVATINSNQHISCPEWNQHEIRLDRTPWSSLLPAVSCLLSCMDVPSATTLHAAKRDGKVMQRKLYLEGKGSCHSNVRNFEGRKPATSQSHHHRRTTATLRSEAESASNAVMSSKIVKLPSSQQKRKTGTDSGRNFSVRPTPPTIAVETPNQADMLTFAWWWDYSTNRSHERSQTCWLPFLYNDRT